MGDSIEERMLALQEQKRDLMKAGGAHGGEGARRGVHGQGCCRCCALRGMLARRLCYRACRCCLPSD